jgi:hypothetical protein
MAFMNKHENVGYYVVLSELIDKFCLTKAQLQLWEFTSFNLFETFKARKIACRAMLLKSIHSQSPLRQKGLPSA